MFIKYDNRLFKKLNTQHNIMVLVGNGFDLALLKKYKTGKMKGKTSSYEDFYEYIKYYKLTDSENILFEKMTEDLENGRENWSDFELTIHELLREGVAEENEIERGIDEFQGYFTKFLNELVDAELLLKINAEVQEKKLARQSLSHFLNDLNSSCDIEFPEKTDHYDLFNYVFFNFNYTSLLDNYLYLDKVQFEPHKWKSADRNFEFYPEFDPPVKNPTIWSSYLLTDIIHPHGVQSIPRSILFGIDMEKYHKGKSKEKRFVKSYWAQYEIKYESYFRDAELFIIFGMSLSMTDGWWLDQIFDAILNNHAELIIYKYGVEDEEAVKETFIKACIRHKKSLWSTEIKEVKKRIYVVSFKKNNTYFLGFEERVQRRGI